MRQQLSTLLIVITLTVLMIETFLVYLDVTSGAPLLRMVCFVILTMYILITGENNRREYEYKRKKIKRLKDAALRKSMIDEYEAFRKEMHG
ncbi:MAG: hypothetical protein Q4A15_06420 [Prevotellaceae bacterium]|nr:hypothetical protein [Prevotellaceae bacterium]